jgi:hypothetical protein
VHRRHAVIRNGDDVCLPELGVLDDLFEIAVRDLIRALEIFRVTLPFGAVLETLLARIDQRELMAGLIRLHLVAHQKIEIVILNREQHRLVEVVRQALQLLHISGFVDK